MRSLLIYIVSLALLDGETLNFQNGDYVFVGISHQGMGEFHYYHEVYPIITHYIQGLKEGDRAVLIITPPLAKLNLLEEFYLKFLLRSAEGIRPSPEYTITLGPFNFQDKNIFFFDKTLTGASEPSTASGIMTDMVIQMIPFYFSQNVNLSLLVCVADSPEQMKNFIPVPVKHSGFNWKFDEIDFSKRDYERLRKEFESEVYK